MTLVNDEGVDIFAAPASTPEPVPGFSRISGPQAFAESFTSENSVGAAMQLGADYLMAPRFAPDPKGFMPTLEQLEGYQDNLGPLVNSKSQQEFDYWKERIDEKRRREQDIANSGGWGGAGAMLGIMMSPESFVGLGEGRAVLRTMGATAIGSSLRLTEQPERQAGSILIDMATAGMATSLFSRTRALTEAGGARIRSLGRRYAGEKAEEDVIYAGKPGATGTDMPAAGIYRADGTLDEKASIEFRAGSHMRQGEEWRAVDVRPGTAPDSTVGAAAATPTWGLTTAALMERETLERTGAGLERAPISPMLRLLNNKYSLTAREVIQRLTEVPLFIRKNFLDEASPISVVQMRRKWYGVYVGMRAGIREDFMALRRAEGTNSGGMVRTQIADIFGGPSFLKKPTLLHEFNEQVSWALRDIEEPHLFSKYPPEIQSAAKKAQQFFARFKGEMDEVGFFEAQISHQLAKLEEKLSAERAKLNPSAQYLKKLEDARDELKMRIDKVRAGFSKPNYVPRVYLRGAIRKREAEFKTILVQHGLKPDEADELIGKILRDNPFTPIDPDLDVGFAGSGRAMTLDFIPDRHLADFIQNDIDTLMGHYTKTVGTDLEMVREFGSTHLDDLVDEITQEMEKAGASRAEIANAVKDLRAARDLVRGTHALPEDPANLTSRAIRVAKQFNSMLLLTGAQSALPDLGRIIMAHGLKDAFELGLKPLIQHFKVGGGAYQMAKAEVNLAGEAIDSVMGWRGMLQADMMDGIENTTRFEHWMTRASNATFSINLMNQWTDGVKTITAMVSGTKMLDATLAHVNGNISEKMAARLAQRGIDSHMAKRIWQQFSDHGATINGVKVANVEKWTDEVARQHWEGALTKELNTVIVTPSPGEKPLFMSNELGSLLFQYRGYGVSATQRILMAGLQERDAKALAGVAAMIGLGMMVEGLRRTQTGDDRELGMGGWIKAGIDRSGVLGIVMDLNNAMETLSGGYVGVGGLLGAAKTSSQQGVVSTLLGPTGSTVGRFGDLSEALASGSNVGKAVRRVLPTQGVFYLDGLFDQLHGGSK